MIGPFIEEKIPRGLTLQETVRDQSPGRGLYVPASVRSAALGAGLRASARLLDEIDAIEVFNPRVAISEFNEEALSFAAKYRIPAGAGSTPTSPRGSARCESGCGTSTSEEFLESLRDADIVRNPASLLYVQALKFLQTKALPESARNAARERRVRRKYISCTQLLMQSEGQCGPPVRSEEVCRPPTTRFARSTSSGRSASSTHSPAELRRCRHCPRGQLMPVLGSGHPQADIFLVKHSAAPAEVEEGLRSTAAPATR